MLNRRFIVALALGVLCGCGTERKNADVPVTLNDDVPFLGLGYVGYENILKHSTRLGMAREAFRRMLFEEEYLLKGTPYFPELEDVAGRRQVLVVSDGTAKLIVVTAFVYDNAAHTVRRRRGLIPYAEYERFLTTQNNEQF